MWRRPDRGRIEAARDTAETAVVDHTALAVRRFLVDASRAARAALDTPAMVAAGTPTEPITIGAFERFWLAALSRGSVLARIRDTWLTGYRTTTDQRVISTSLDALPVYMASVSDRLVRGITPPLPAAAFDTVRVITTRAAALGWSTAQTSARIAAELGWEIRAPYWRTQLDRTNTAIDQILDPLGAPGTPGREHARLHDARVKVLQADRASIVSKLDAEASTWQTRATAIARTETTGAYNAGATYALQQEGVSCKQWLATNDARTRPEHADADGQVVGIHELFDVGGFSAPHPGAASLPPELSVNCRCTVIGAPC